MSDATLSPPPPPPALSLPSPPSVPVPSFPLPPTEPVCRCSARCALCSVVPRCALSSYRLRRSACSIPSPPSLSASMRREWRWADRERDAPSALHRRLRCGGCAASASCSSASAALRVSVFLLVSRCASAWTPAVLPVGLPMRSTLPVSRSLWQCALLLSYACALAWPIPCPPWSRCKHVLRASPARDRDRRGGRGLRLRANRTHSARHTDSDASRHRGPLEHSRHRDGPLCAWRDRESDLSMRSLMHGVLLPLLLSRSFAPVLARPLPPLPSAGQRLFRVCNSSTHASDRSSNAQDSAARLPGSTRPACLQRAGSARKGLLCALLCSGAGQRRVVPKGDAPPVRQ